MLLGAELHACHLHIINLVETCGNGTAALSMQPCISNCRKAISVLSQIDAARSCVHTTPQSPQSTVGRRFITPEPCTNGAPAVLAASCCSYNAASMRTAPSEQQPCGRICASWPHPVASKAGLSMAAASEKHAVHCCPMAWCKLVFRCECLPTSAPAVVPAASRQSSITEAAMRRRPPFLLSL